MYENRKLAFNMVGSVLAFILSIAISFFLTPYIVRTLGAAAYGFIGLTSSIIGYTSIVTVALNAMAGRFISLSYLKGDKVSSNKYYSSVFYSNCIISLFILLIAVVLIVFIDKILNVPAELLSDVRLLMSLVTISSIIELVTNQFGISMYITNRLYLSSVRQMIGSIGGSIILGCAYIFFTPHVWYNGLSGLILAMYTAYANRMLHRRLTPDLRINIKYFDFKKIKELVASGSWNLITKLSDILGQGMDLLFANLFVGAAPMGRLSITKSVTSLCLGLFGSISGVFGPTMTKLYAENKIAELVADFKKSIRILSCFSAPILCCVIIYCKDFYSLWMPQQNSSFLQMLTILGLMASIFSWPLQALWNIFTITNKVKNTSLALLAESILSFITIVVAMQFVDDQYSRLVVIVSARSGWGLLRNMTLLPLYGAYCLKQDLLTFYHVEIKTLIALFSGLLLSFLLKDYVVSINGWFSLIIAGCVTAIIAFFCNYYIVLNKTDKEYLKAVLKAKLHLRRK